MDWRDLFNVVVCQKEANQLDLLKDDWKPWDQMGLCLEWHFRLKYNEKVNFTVHSKYLYCNLLLLLDVEFDVYVLLHIVAIVPFLLPDSGAWLPHRCLTLVDKVDVVVPNKFAE
jgi:hypothetical protein